MALTTTHTINTEDLTFIVSSGAKHHRDRTTGEVTIDLPADETVTVIGRLTVKRSTSASRGEVFIGAVCNYRIVSGILASVTRTLQRQDYVNSNASAITNLTATEEIAPTLTASTNNYQVSDTPAVAETFVTSVTSTTSTYIYSVTFTPTVNTILLVRSMGVITETNLTTSGTPQVDVVTGNMALTGAASLTPSYTLVRVGRQVTLTVNTFSFTNSSGVTINDSFSQLNFIPAGYRPAVNQYFPAYSGTVGLGAESLDSVVAILSNGALYYGRNGFAGADIVVDFSINDGNFIGSPGFTVTWISA